MFEKFNESVSQKEKFRIAANKLLNQCFLLKKKEDTKKEYVFVRENMESFREFFDFLGYSIKENQDMGVIALVGEFETGRLALTKLESIELLLLRLLYIEKRKEISNSYNDVIVIMEEIREKYNLLRIKSKPYMDKGMERHMISLFRKYNIVKNLDSDVNQADTRIIIYPSVIMAATVDDIDAYYKMTETKLQEYADANSTGRASDEDSSDSLPDEGEDIPSDR